MSADPQSLLRFWQYAGERGDWFEQRAAFDRRFRKRFLEAHLQAARGQLSDWTAAAQTSLALVILLDQFPRNAFRGTPHMYGSDRLALAAAKAMIERGFDHEIDEALRVFCYLPLAHSETLADQETSLQLQADLGEPFITHARRHHDIVRRFGRFPHRNELLGRSSTPEEQTFLAEGGFAG